MIPIKRKIVSLFSALFAVALIIIASVQMLSLRAKVVTDIRESALHFAELSSGQIWDLYNLYYRSQSYALWKSELTDILRRNPAITQIRIETGDGAVLADSLIDGSDKELPAEKNPLLQTQLKSSSLSAHTTGNAIIYMEQQKGSSTYSIFNADRKALPSLSADTELTDITVPLPDNMHRVIYTVDYSAVGDLLRQSILTLLGLFVAGFAATALIAGWFARGLTRPLAQLREGAERIARGELTTRIQVKSNDETKLLADTFNSMAHDLSAALETKVAYERTAKELEIASEIQTSFLPKKIEVPGLETAMSFEPASEVGGDVYDVLPINDHQTLLYLGDATGHGTAAGMVSALTNASIATAAISGHNLTDILTHANTVIHSKTKSNMFITLLACLWDANTKHLTYAVAGHELPLIYRATTHTVESGASGSMGLGMLPRLTPAPAIHTLPLAAGDVVLLYTDGLNEAANSTGKLFGNEQLKKSFAEAAKAGGTLEDMRTRIIASLDTFRGDIPLADDVTVMLLRMK